MNARSERNVTSQGELVAALSSGQSVTVTGFIGGLETIRLRPGQSLRGVSEDAGLGFAPHEDGVQLSVDNALSNLCLRADVEQRAIYNDVTVSTLGRLVMRHLEVTGNIRILAREAVRSGHVEAHCVYVESADARHFEERPRGYGVEVVPGVFTVWNQQTDHALTITAELTCISAGRAGAPVRGSGVFISGAGDVGGRLVARRLETGAVFSDGGIAAGTADRISGGVFVMHGAHIANVRNHAPVTTYGPNDMVLDNWGSVDRWTAHGEVTSLGPSGIGFVNFGTIGVLEVLAPIETFGQGARGFNVYAGSVQNACFERITTRGDGAVGLQISQPVGNITVLRGLETFGGRGDSLVKGVVMQLPATALSVKPGGAIRQLDIRGGLTTHGAGIDAMEIHGSIDSLRVIDGILAQGYGFATL